MKKIINGKKYNTETAQKMGERDSEHEVNDFESLYRKKTGEFFLHSYCEGGGLNGGGDQIIPLTEREAKEWAEARLEEPECEAIFGRVKENRSDKIVNLTITVRSHEILKRIQSRTGKTMGEIVDELIEVEREKYNL